MTTYDLMFDSATSPGGRPSPLGLLRRFWAGYRRRRAERRLVVTLSQLDERILRDIGVEPQDVIAAIEGRPAPSILLNPMRRKPDHE